MQFGNRPDIDFTSRAIGLMYASNNTDNVKNSSRNTGKIQRNMLLLLLLLHSYIHTRHYQRKILCFDTFFPTHIRQILCRAWRPKLVIFQSKAYCRRYFVWLMSLSHVVINGSRSLILTRHTRAAFAATSAEPASLFIHLARHFPLVGQSNESRNVWQVGINWRSKFSIATFGWCGEWRASILYRLVAVGTPITVAAAAYTSGGLLELCNAVAHANIRSTAYQTDRLSLNISL